MAIFQASLCRMDKGNLVPYDSATIETNSGYDAVEKAKRWALTVDDRDDAWLQVLFEGEGVAKFKPGAF